VKTSKSLKKHSLWTEKAKAGGRKCHAKTTTSREEKPVKLKNGCTACAQRHSAVPLMPRLPRHKRYMLVPRQGEAGKTMGSGRSAYNLR
jgi:hypothetical protein